VNFLSTPLNCDVQLYNKVPDSAEIARDSKLFLHECLPRGGSVSNTELYREYQGLCGIRTTHLSIAAHQDDSEIMQTFFSID